MAVRQNSNKMVNKYGRSLKNMYTSIVANTFAKYIAPKSGYYFHSDYFEIDSHVATILTIYSKMSGNKRLSQRWGLGLLPNLDIFQSENVKIRLLSQIDVIPDNVVKQYDSSSSAFENLQNDNTARSNSSQIANNASINDFSQIIQDTQVSMDTYMNVCFKLLIKADTIETLDKVVDEFNRIYKLSFDGLYTAQHLGEQYEDFQNILDSAKDQLGENMMFTASELAGEYSLMTQGLNDESGEFVGTMYGEAFMPAVLWDLNKWRSHCVIASNGNARTATNDRILKYNQDNTDKIKPFFAHGVSGASMWDVKLAQSVMSSGNKVINFVLSDANLDKVGLSLKDMTTRFDMFDDIINPFQIFGDLNDIDASGELMAFPANLDKLKAMFIEIALGANSKNSDSKILTAIDSKLSTILRDFYIDRGMWRENAKSAENRKKLRILNLPNNEYPELSIFDAYVSQSVVEADKNNRQGLYEQYEAIQTITSLMLNYFSAQFNGTSTSKLADAKKSLQVTFDFARAFNSSENLAMAQFINAFHFVIQELHLKRGSVIVIHGCELLNDTVKAFIKSKMKLLSTRGVRIVYSYDNVSQAINDTEFNHLANADFTLFNCFSGDDLDKYIKAIKLDIFSESLRKQLTSDACVNDLSMYYLKRGSNNIIFRADPLIDLYNSKAYIRNALLKSKNRRFTLT